MNESLDHVKVRALEAFAAATTEALLIQARARYLGKKGEITALMKDLAALPLDVRKAAGQSLNALKEELENAASGRLEALRRAEMHPPGIRGPDASVAGRPVMRGHIHPISRVLFEIEDIFRDMGFDVEDGPEIEEEYYNFEALNIPPGHPAREMQDTFYINDELVLRTHTSPVQVRTMEGRPPPLRIIAPGAVYRSDMDMTHSPMFHQVEGLMVDTDISLSDLKGILLEFVRRMFGADRDVRFRCSFFPFTEPSAEVDMSCFLCLGKGCRTCKMTGWIEIGGCGMVNPVVFRAIRRPGYDPEQIRGFAFGMGIERIALLKYGISDLRLFFDNDLRLLEQF